MTECLKFLEYNEWWTYFSLNILSKYSERSVCWWWLKFFVLFPWLLKFTFLRMLLYQNCPAIPLYFPWVRVSLVLFSVFVILHFKCSASCAQYSVRSHVLKIPGASSLSLHGLPITTSLFFVLILCKLLEMFSVDIP